MATTGKCYPTVQSAISGTWGTTGNIIADDGAYATVSPAKNQTNTLEVGGFGFDALLPAGATITQVVLEFQFKVSTTSSVATAHIRARVNGADLTNHTDNTEPTTDTMRSYDITGERTWTRADLLDAAFAVRVDGQRGNSNNAVTFSFDYVAVTVQYAVVAALATESVGTGTAAADLRTAELLAGTSAGTGTAQGGLTVTAAGVSLGGTSAGIGAAQAQPQVGRLMGALSAGAGAVAAALKRGVSLFGAPPGQAPSTASLQVGRRLGTQSAGEGSVRGALQLPDQATTALCRREIALNTAKGGMGSLMPR